MVDSHSMAKFVQEKVFVMTEFVLPMSVICTNTFKGKTGK